MFSVFALQKGRKAIDYTGKKPENPSSLSIE